MYTTPTTEVINPSRRAAHPRNAALTLSHIRRHNACCRARCHRQYAEGFRRLLLAFVNNLSAYEYLALGVWRMPGA
jgi:hypothetical protein